MIDPQDLGFPEKFDRFRDAQLEAFEFAITSECRFVAIGAPPGVGKSGIAYGLAKLLGGRTTILTATHGLENQYLETFNNEASTQAVNGNTHARIAHIRGRRNYQCWEGGNCDDGRRMACGDKLGCPYLADLRAFNDDDGGGCSIGVTNYAYWLAVNANRDGIAKPDTLICDEAGLADGWLSNALDFRLTEREGKEAGLNIGRPSEDIQDWLLLSPRILQAAYTHLEAVKDEARGFKVGRDLARLRRAEDIYDKATKLSRINTDQDNWLVTRVDGSDEGRLWKFQCIWPGMYKERLFQGIQRVILMSATMRPKTLNLLGIRRDDCEFKEWGRQFPAINGPVIWVPTVKMKHGMDSEDTRRWLDRHDEIYTWGSDRKGITHTVSYDRAKQLRDELAGRHKLHFNGAADPDSATATQAYRDFVQAPDGSVLVSPSFSTGWDFAGRLAEWQVISKIAFVPTKDRLVQARTEQDREYPLYVAAQDLVQACGRINRYEEDRGTTIIIDDQVGRGWFKHGLKDHAPKWFTVRREEQLPAPLPKL